MSWGGIFSGDMSERLEELKAALKGTYEIERELGRGGMATVYLARDLKHEREVAIKVLRPDLAAALGPDRFLREIRIAANLTHPHILPLHDSGEADGFLYYVMPFIEGQTLRDRIDKEGELPIAEAVRIIREVVDALAFAHSKGVVHRDIKPDNIMLTGGWGPNGDQNVLLVVRPRPEGLARRLCRTGCIPIRFCAPLVAWLPNAERRHVPSSAPPSV